MSNIRKHTDVVASMEEFTTNFEQGMYVAPWIVYVGNNDTGYSVIYSNDEKRSHGSADIDFIDSLANRVIKLETEKVFCYEHEYDTLVSEGKGYVTNLDNSKTEVVFDANKLYCIYEEDGPAGTPEQPEEPTPSEPSEPEQPEEPTPDEPIEPENPEQPEEPTPGEPSEPENPENGEVEPSEPMTVTCVYHAVMTEPVRLAAETITFDKIVVDGEEIEFTQSYNSLTHSFNETGNHTVEFTLNVPYIDGNTFENCIDMVSVSVSNGVTEIKGNAFQNCLKLQDVTLGQDVINLASYAFDGTTKLKTITCYSTTPPTLNRNTFTNAAQYGTIYYPANADYSAWNNVDNTLLTQYFWTLQAMEAAEDIN